MELLTNVRLKRDKVCKNSVRYRGIVNPETGTEMQVYVPYATGVTPQVEFITLSISAEMTEPGRTS